MRRQYTGLPALAGDAAVVAVRALMVQDDLAGAGCRYEGDRMVARRTKVVGTHGLGTDSGRVSGVEEEVSVGLMRPDKRTTGTTCGIGVGATGEVALPLQFRPTRRSLA